MITAALLFLSLSFGAQGQARAQASSGSMLDAPDMLVTEQGLELRSDERVFALFAALNALGYSEETERQGPPLRAPVFDPIRTFVRDALRKVKDRSATDGISAMFEENPAEIEAYLEAVLMARGREGPADPKTEKLRAAVSALDGFRQKAELSQLFDAIAVEQRSHAKELKSRLERDAATAAKVLGLASFRFPPSIVVIPNPLDGHDLVRRVQFKDGSTVLVVGPGYEAAERVALQVALEPHFAAWVEKSWGSAKNLQKHWEGLRGYRRIAEQYADGRAYAARTLARIVAWRIRAQVRGVDGAQGEEEFIDAEAKDGLRWTRAILRALDGKRPDESFESALIRLLAKASP